MAGDIKTRSASKAKPTDKEKFLAKARERFTAAQEYWNKIYGPAKEDLKFYAGEQWPEWVAKQRNKPGSERPMLTINRLPQFHNQIVNDYRQSTISLRAQPQEAHDEDTADAYQGLFRQIEKISIAQLAYIKALSDGATIGVGYITATTDYVSEDSFLQDILIKRVTSPFRHFPDPSAREFFLEDSEFWFVVESISNDAYDELYDKDKRTDFEGFDGEDDWRGENETIVAQYWYYKRAPAVLCLFKDGSSAWEDEIAKDHEHFDASLIINRRTVNRKKLFCALIDGANVLDEKEWPRPRIPHVPVWGNEIWIDDQRIVRGFVHNAKDSCRMFNYLKSAEAEAIALAPKAPYIVEEGQIEGHEDAWKNAANNPQAFLKYKGVAVDGHLVGPPQRQAYEAPVAAIVQASMHSSDDMKATIGIYDASLGARSNEVSGKAITARKRESDTSTYNYVDNLALSIGYLGTIIAELMPVYYDSVRTIRIVGDDGESSTVKINDKDENGKPVPKSPQIADIRYDLVLDTGPSFQTQREETASTIVDLAHNYPDLMKFAGDIAIGSMNFKGAREIAARLKRAIPPQVVGEDEDPETQLAAAKQQLEQGKEIVAQLTQKVAEQAHELDKAKLELKNKDGELEVKRDALALEREKLIAESRNATEGDGSEPTMEGLQHIAAALLELGSDVEQLKEMIMATVDEKGQETPTDVPPGAEAAPPTPEEGIPGNAP
jgi:hypothetical protein